jgi:7-cyano-7-deazaguanine synthase in queuosine biosynthesis
VFRFFYRLMGWHYHEWKYKSFVGFMGTLTYSRYCPVCGKLQACQDRGAGFMDIDPTPEEIEMMKR